MAQNRADMLKDGNMHVVLVGTGGPFPNTEMNNPSALIEPVGF